MVDHAFLYVVYCNCMVYHGLPFTKQYGILTWNTMVYFHKGGKAMKMVYGFIHNLKIKYRHQPNKCDRFVLIAGRERRM